MQIALAGIGTIAKAQHVPSIAGDPDWHLAATLSRNGRIADVPGYQSLDAMLAAHPEITTVSLCLPPVPRFAVAAEALIAGRHVMLEKPPGATLSEVRYLADLAQANGVTLFTSWHSRAAQMVPAAKAWLAGKTLRKLRVTWKEDVRHWHPGQAWIWEPGGMGVLDPGINAISIVTEILSEPIHITSATLEVPENAQTPIAADLQFWHPSAEVSMVCDWRQEGDQTWTIEAVCDDGQMVLADGGARMIVDGTEQLADGPDDGEYPRLYKQMADLVRAGRSDVDLAPMRHVSDALALGHRITVAPFED
ncbi:MAG: Gfo/Idh/MocA family oxidoreductase [Pseudomonadota bacterium]